MRRRILVVLLLVLLASVAAYKPVMKMYHGLTLFSPDKLTVNFRSLDRWFAVRSVAAGPEKADFNYDLQDLPQTYVYAGQTKSTAQFMEDTQTTGLIVTRGGTVVYEEYFLGNSASSRCILWSVSKSIVSALVGIVVEEGLIRDLSDPVTAYVPSLAGSGYDGVSIKDALQMSSGIRFIEDYADPKSDVNRMGSISVGVGGTLESFLGKLENEREPGSSWKYASSDTQVLGMVLRVATGRDLASYAQEKLWQPAGMEADAHWLVDKAGVEAAFGGLNVVLRDMARFGNIYLNNGFWNGRQIISPEWIRASITPDAPRLRLVESDGSGVNMGYGYQWWVPDGEEGDFLAMGIYGQAVYVNPRRGVVVAKTSAYRDYLKDGKAMELESVEFFRAIARAFGTL